MLLYRTSICLQKKKPFSTESHTSLNITSIWKINVNVWKEMYPVNDKRVKLSDYAPCRPRPICLGVNNNCGVPTVQKIYYIITYIWTQITWNLTFSLGFIEYQLQNVVVQFEQPTEIGLSSIFVFYIQFWYWLYVCCLTSVQGHLPQKWKLNFNSEIVLSFLKKTVKVLTNYIWNNQ